MRLEEERLHRLRAAMLLAALTALLLGAGLGSALRTIEGGAGRYP